MLTAKVILRDSVRATDKLFTYLVPDNLKERVQEGLYVLVPFGRGNKMKTAVIFSVQEEEKSQAQGDIRHNGRYPRSYRRAT